MSKLQDTFNRIQELKKEQKDIKASYRDSLSQYSGYKEVSEELATFREKKKEIEMSVKEEYSKEFIKLEDLKIDLESEMELLNDIAVSKLMKGETVEVTDQYDNQYEPVFSVKFRKAK